MQGEGVMDIDEFLKARLDHREQWARAADHAVGTKYDPIVAAAGETLSVPLMELYRAGRPARVLAEVAAKRALLKRLEEDVDRCTDDAEWRGASLALARVQEHLAAAWSDHPDYDPAWRVE